MEELTISFDKLIHPDLEAIKKRDAFLSDEHMDEIDKLLLDNIQETTSQK